MVKVVHRLALRLQACKHSENCREPTTMLELEGIGRQWGRRSADGEVQSVESRQGSGCTRVRVAFSRTATSTAPHSVLVVPPREYSRTRSRGTRSKLVWIISRELVLCSGGRIAPRRTRIGLASAAAMRATHGSTTGARARANFVVIIFETGISCTRQAAVR